MPIADAAFFKIVRGHFNGDAISHQDLDFVFPDFPSCVGVNCVPIFKLNAKACVGKDFGDGAIEFKCVRFCHWAPQGLVSMWLIWFFEMR